MERLSTEELTQVTVYFVVCNGVVIRMFQWFSHLWEAYVHRGLGTGGGGDAHDYPRLSPASGLVSCNLL